MCMGIHLETKKENLLKKELVLTRMEISEIKMVHFWLVRMGISKETKKEDLEI
jgi:hypothetical protein